MQIEQFKNFLKIGDEISIKYDGKMVEDIGKIEEVGSKSFSLRFPSDCIMIIPFYYEIEKLTFLSKAEEEDKKKYVNVKCPECCREGEIREDMLPKEEKGEDLKNVAKEFVEDKWKEKYFNLLENIEGSATASELHKGLKEVCSFLETRVREEYATVKEVVELKSSIHSTKENLKDGLFNDYQLREDVKKCFEILISEIQDDDVNNPNKILNILNKEE